jgi:hypothetical protein
MADSFPTIFTHISYMEGLQAHPEQSDIVCVYQDEMEKEPRMNSIYLPGDANARIRINKAGKESLVQVSIIQAKDEEGLLIKNQQTEKDSVHLSLSRQKKKPACWKCKSRDASRRTGSNHDT